MRKTLIAAILAAGLVAPLAAQNAPAPAAPAAAKPGNTPEDRARGAVIFRTFAIAINSDKVKPAVKNQLVACLYNNPMRNISVATGNVFAKNTSLDAKKPEQIFSIAAQVCGVKPATAANGATPAPAQAAAQPANPTGR